MWFLYALLYDYILWSIVDRHDLYKYAYPAAVILLGAYILLAQGAYFLGIEVQPVLYRNFLFLGFPWFMIGHWIHRNQEKILISNKLLLIIAVVSTLLCPLERLLMGRVFGVQLLSYPQLLSLFLLTIQNPTFGSGSKLSAFGLHYSMFIYIFQFAVIRAANQIYTALGITANDFALCVKPLLVLLFTIVLSAIVLWAKNHLFKRQVKT